MLLRRFIKVKSDFFLYSKVSAYFIIISLNSNKEIFPSPFESIFLIKLSHFSAVTFIELKVDVSSSLVMNPDLSYLVKYFKTITSKKRMLKNY